LHCGGLPLAAELFCKVEDVSSIDVELVVVGHIRWVADPNSEDAKHGVAGHAVG
jgi:hypothetical protein